MQAAKKQRGATAIRNTRARLSYQRLLVGAGVCVGLVLAFFTIPWGAEPPAKLPAAPIEAPVDIVVTDTLEATLTVEPADSGPQWQPQSVQSGDNLSLIFKRAGYGDRDLYKVVNQAADGKQLAKIFPGQTIEFLADTQGKLSSLRYIKSPLESIIYELGDNGFNSRVTVRTPQVRQTTTSAVITSSLFLAGQEAGLSHNMIMEMANIFGGVIDFVQDPRTGDTVHLIYEELYLDGEHYKDGDIIAASFINRGEIFSAYQYQDSNGDTSYYNEDGVSMRKAFLLAPLDFTRISSNFNMRRLHPIYKTTRPHRGTDYAASRGTPVFAAGDGKVIKAGYTKANGNYVFIQHGEDIVTRYLHLHKRKVKRGQRVAQSQVIGTVGSTGAATGPHLHYEFLMNGVHRNPRTVHKKLPKAKALENGELPRFQQAIAKNTQTLDSLRDKNQLAPDETQELAAN